MKEKDVTRKDLDFIEKFVKHQVPTNFAALAKAQMITQAMPIGYVWHALNATKAFEESVIAEPTLVLHKEGLDIVNYNRRLVIRDEYDEEGDYVQTAIWNSKGWLPL